MLQRRFTFDDLFSEFLGAARNAPYDVHEGERGFEVEVDLPGVEPADIDIRVSGGKLSIKAERKWAKENGKAAFRRSFAETFVLPDTVDPDGISATCGQGVLKVTLPKRAGSPERRVEVKVP